MNLAQDERVDWIKVLDDLRDKGYGDNEVGHRLGVDRSKVRKWRDNKSELRHDDGERLLAMWSEMMRTHRFVAPRVTVAQDFKETEVPYVDVRDRASAILSDLRRVMREFRQGSKVQRMLAASIDRLEGAVATMRRPAEMDLADEGELPL